MMDERIPVFLLDSHEHFQPIAVESVEEVPATIVLPGAGEKDGGPVKLDALPPLGGRMNFPPNPREQEERLRPKFGGVAYRREVEDGGLTWIQYWLWYLYNPKEYVLPHLDIGVHEGDWEFVQVGYKDGEPWGMTVSQHHSGGRREWKKVEQRDGRPVVYVARDSHANYFEPVDDIEEIEDDANGKGTPLPELEWRSFGPWATWYGRWGNSTGKGTSPQSPGQQCARFYLPRTYHEAAEDQ
jgi:hypothetical protein